MIDRMAAELLDLVATHVDYVSLKAMRLTSSGLNHAATPLVFSHFRMAYLDRSLDDLVQLSTSRLAKYVKTFTFYTDLLPCWQREQWWLVVKNQRKKRDARSERLAKHSASCAVCNDALLSSCRLYQDLTLGPAPALGRNIPQPELSESQLEEAWRCYLNVSSSQSQWHSGDRAVRFKTHFALLLNVEEVVMTSAILSGGGMHRSPLWRVLRQRILVRPDGWVFDNYVPELGIQAKGQATLCVLEVIALRGQCSQGKRVTKLHIDQASAISYHELLNLNGWHPDSSEQQVQLWAREVFGHLLDLRLGAPERLEHLLYKPVCEGSISVAAETAKLLFAAKQLRRLDLTYSRGSRPRVGRCNKPVIPLLNGEAGVIWPRLAHLAINVENISEGFLDCLRNHAATLRSLELRDLMVYNVRDLLAEIPQVLPLLEHVYIVSLYDVTMSVARGRWFNALPRGTDFDDPYEKSVMAYLLGQTDELPELKGTSDRFLTTL